MDSFRLPKVTLEQQKARDLAIAAATREATRIPLSVLEKTPALLELAAEIGKIGNANSLSDAGVAVLTGMTAAEGAYYNVLINLESLSELDQSAEPGFFQTTRQRAVAALDACEKLSSETRRRVRDELESVLDS